MRAARISGVPAPERGPGTCAPRRDLALALIESLDGPAEDPVVVDEAWRAEIESLEFCNTFDYIKAAAGRCRISERCLCNNDRERRASSEEPYGMSR
jgi:hypothetical protein